MAEPYYEDDAVTIYHGDCLELMPTGVDAFITSPPYNLGQHPTREGSGMHAGSIAAQDLAGGYGEHDDAMPQDEYDAWQTQVVSAMWEGLADTGAIFYNHKPRPYDGEVKLPTAYGEGLPLRQVIIWDRGTGMNFATTHFLPKCEWICLWAKPGFSLRDRSASQVGDVWRFPPEVAADHPAPFPLGLPARVIEACAPGLVCDPFMGSGTTLRAAKDAGVKAIGIEKSEVYCEIAAKRMGQGVLEFR
jgi:DNA modification methylase